MYVCKCVRVCECASTVDRRPPISSACTPAAVVPPGLMTWSLSTPGCFPVSCTYARAVSFRAGVVHEKRRNGTMAAAPLTVCAASVSAVALIFTLLMYRVKRYATPTHTYTHPQPHTHRHTDTRAWGGKAPWQARTHGAVRHGLDHHEHVSGSVGSIQEHA
jgi:hypothetical protein